jgi:hypothetical protein
MKNEKQTILENKYRWVTSSELPDSALDILESASRAIREWMQIPGDHNLKQIEVLNKRIGMTFWEPSNIIWRKFGFHHVEFDSVFIDPGLITVEMAVHEFAHILDNSFGSHRLASIFGGGPADEMIRFLGVEPDLFLPRFYSRNYESTLQQLNLELNPTLYGRTRGPSEDFAESFRLAVLHPEQLKTAAPIRFKWFSEWRTQLMS